MGTLLGAAFITVLAKGQTLLGVPSNYQSFTRGIVILIAVALDVLSQRGINAGRLLRRPRAGPTRRVETRIEEVPRAQPEQQPGVPLVRSVQLSKSFVELRADDAVDFDVYAPSTRR